VSQTMKIKKGDVVHILTGKDRGRQGHVIDARPADRKVVVENINIAKRHTKPRPIQRANRMGGVQMTEGGIIEIPVPIPVGNVMLVCPTCKLPTRVGTVVKQVGGRTVRVRVCKRAGCGQEIPG
jgi:large subunit ribosomal protein L24